MAALILGGVLSASSVACTTPKSGLMLAITTDMRAPKDVNAVGVTIFTNGAIKHNVVGRVTPDGEVLLPATLAIAEPEDPNASIRIRVLAFQERRARVMREVRTSIPAGGRVALLRIPLNFVNDGSVSGQLPEGVLPAPNPVAASGSDGGSEIGLRETPVLGFGDSYDPTIFNPSCDDPNHTWIDGKCADAYVDPETLPTYEEAEVGSATDPAVCFDPGKCFSGSIEVKPGAQELALDAARCTVPLGSLSPSLVNFALVTKDVGVCLTAGECYVPIDQGGEGGWLIEGPEGGPREAKLSASVCELIQKKSLRLFVSRTSCESKKASNPICYGPVPAPPPPPGVDGGPPPAPSGLIIAEYYPMAVAASAKGLVFAGPNRIGRLDFGSDGAPGMPVPITGMPAGKRPWIVAVDRATGEAAWTDGTATRWLLPAGATAAAAVTSPNVTSARGVGFLPGWVMWAGAGADPSSPGVVEVTKRDGQLFVTSAEDAVQETLHAYGTDRFVTGGGGGIQAWLMGPNGPDYVGTRVPIADGKQPIDAITVNGNGDMAYVVAGGAVYPVPLGVSVTTPPKPLAMLGNTSGVTLSEGTFRRGIVASAQCLFVATDRGLEWYQFASGTSGIAAPATSSILGVALGPPVPGSSVVDPLALYWTVFGPLDGGGGVYMGPLPVACGGTPPPPPPTDGGTPLPDAGTKDATSDLSVADALVEVADVFVSDGSKLEGGGMVPVPQPLPAL